MQTKDQQRASYAYEKVSALRDLPDASREDYKIAVKALGANILRSGLSAALADLMRRKAEKVLDDLAKAGVPGIGADTEGAGLFKTVNRLGAGEYMLATRETLQVVMWLKRACDALFDSPQEAAAGASGPDGGGHA